MKQTSRESQRQRSGNGSLLSVALGGESDFLVARQRAKQIAALMGFEQQDQTRVATAVSEIARNALEYAGGGRVQYFYDMLPEAQLRIVISDKGKGIRDLEQIWAGTYRSSTGMGVGLTGTRRLLDTFNLESGPGGTTATLVKVLPVRGQTPPTLAYLAEQLAKTETRPQGALDSLNSQNQELLTLLGDLRARETELQRLNEELEETNRGVLVLYAELEDKAQSVQQASEMKTRFLSGVTHELRTPLNSIVSLARLLLYRTDGELNTEQEKQVQFILRSAQNLSEMVNDLLDMAKVEAGRATMKLTEFKVADMLAGLRGMFRPLLINERVKLIFEIPEEPLALKTDEGKLAQILRNLVSNALKFTERGTVTVSTKIAEDMLVFAVADTGVGIAPEHFEVVMQEWGQVEGMSGQRQKGSGLGLPLSRRFAELLGGEIRFESTRGVGSTFFVSLPVALLVDQMKPEMAVVEAPRHILMADDDEVSRYLLRRRLETLTSAKIVEVKDGRECLDSIAAEVPQILFLDLLMPGVSGIQLAKELRAQERTAELAIVAVTVKVLTEEEREELEAMQIPVISKREGNPLASEVEEDLVLLERVLLQVGLNNLHQEASRR